MKKFVLKIIYFSLPLIIVIAFGLFLPPTPQVSKSYLFANLHKDSLLNYVNSPRLIFIGGSNLTFGLNSQMIKDSLGINPINTGLNAGIGLFYMMDNTLLYTKPGDTIILITEYELFFGDNAYGKEALLHTIFDVYPSKLSLLKKEQIFNIIGFVPKYSFSKFKRILFFNSKVSDIYNINSFNKYGDIFTHWGLERQEFKSQAKITDSFNYKVILEINKFREKVERKNATLFISFPGLQDESFQNNVREIRIVQSSYEKNEFKILGSPERYIIHDSMMFDTPYHLNKNGVDYRTALFIQDFKKVRI